MSQCVNEPGTLGKHHLPSCYSSSVLFFTLLQSTVIRATITMSEASMTAKSDATNQQIRVPMTKEHYKVMYGSYEKMTDRIERVNDYCADTFPPVFMDNLTGATGDQGCTKDKPAVVRYLGVGSGSGEADLKIICKVSNEVESMEVTIVEPSAEFIEQFKDRISKETTSLENVTFVWRQETVEDFMKTPRTSIYHCIFMSGVLVYLEDRPKVAEYLYSALADNGTILIATESDGDTNVFFEFWYPGRFPEFGLTIATPTDMIKAFEGVGAKITLSHLKCILDSTSLFEEDSVSGNHLLDFLTDSVDFRKTAPAELKNSILEFLSQAKFTHRENGKVLMENSRQLIMVQK